MKNIKYIILLLTAVIANSCDSYLDIVPDNLTTVDHAFNNKYNAEKFLYTCYSYLPNVHNEGDTPALWGGDEVWLPEYFKNWAGPQLAKGNQNIANPFFNKWSSGYKGLYSGIRKCNVFIKRIDDVPGTSAYTKKAWKAEAKFLKAYYHFYLARMYGAIILADEAVEVSEESAKIRGKRSSVDETFTFIIKLLDEAIESLPLELQYKDEDAGRATKAIAAALKARVLMEYASPLFNGNPVYSSVTDKEGKKLFPQSYDAEKWVKAAEACKVAIDLCHEAGNRLYTEADFISPFKLNEMTVKKAVLRNRITEKWNNEIVWGSTRSTWNIQSISMPRIYDGTGNPVGSRNAPTMRVAEMYYSENGVPINEDKNYDYANRYKRKSIGNAERYVMEPGQETAILHFNREPRFYADVAFDRSAWFGSGREKDDKLYYIRGRGGEFASVRERANYSVTGYWTKKLVSLKTSLVDGKSLKVYPYSFPIIRLADLYLYYAEALNEIKSAPDAEVYEYIDKVRKRAGLAGVVESWATYSNNPGKPGTKEGMRAIIQRERMIEMAFEGGRFWDLRRWKLSNDYMNTPIKGWNVLGETAKDYYNVRVIYNPLYSEKNYLWPIKEYEMVTNPNIVQNPGW